MLWQSPASGIVRQTGCRLFPEVLSAVRPESAEIPEDLPSQELRSFLLLLHLTLPCEDSLLQFL